MRADASSDRTRLTLGGVAAAVFGLALFAYTVRQTGLGAILEGVGRVGGWLAAIVALAGLRFLARARAWSLAADDPQQLRLRDTFPAFVAGDTLGNLTPLGLIVSEPTKAAFVRRRVSLMTALASIAIENLFYAWSAAAIIVAGSAALLFAVDAPAPLRAASLAALGAMAALLLVSLTMIGGNVRLVDAAVGWLERRDLGPDGLRRRFDKLRALEAHIYGFNRRHPRRAGPILLLEASYHVAGVAEAWLTLQLLTSSAGILGHGEPLLLTAFLLESLNRLVNVIFKFVPLRLGVDEASTGLLAQALGLTTAAGVTLAIVRKVRMLCWMAAGVLFIASRGLRPTRAAEEVERAETQ